MTINNIPFLVELYDIVIEWQSQLNLNGYTYLHKVMDTPDNVMVCCPYHKGGQERRPSAGIRKSDGTFHCFACGETHSLQEVISFTFGKTDDMLGAFGWTWLLKNFLTISVEERAEIEIDFSRDRDNSICDICSTNYVSEEELDSYRYIHPYMYKRKLTDEIIDLFDIGYDKDSQCITFPQRDINGNTLFVARRSVNTKFFNYPQSVDKPVYGLYELQKLASDKLNECNVNDLSRWMANEIIICESMLDALTCWVYGKYAVALNGLGTQSQFDVLNKMPCRKFILATDMDEAGVKARHRIKKFLKNKIVTEYVWDLEKAKDINDMSKDMFDNLEEVL